MSRGRLRLKGEEVRDEVEGVLFLLADMRRDLKEVSLRIRQAEQRSTMVRDVLDPADELLEAIEIILDQKFERFGIIWREGQRRNWRDAVSK